MKRVLSVIITLALACVLPFSCVRAEEISLTSRIEGALFSALWGGSASDVLARRLLNGLSPVYWDEEHLRYRQNDKVAGEILVSDTPDGGREYLISFRPDLCFSDGSAVTASDFAFTLLMLASPCVEELGAEGSAYSWLAGWDRYHSGKSKVFSGVRLSGDYQLALTVSPEHLPCFFESGLISVTPFPASRLFPGLTVYDDGEGAFIASDESSLEPFDFHMHTRLRTVLLDPVAGYLGNPAVTSGNYRFAGFDGETLILEPNPYYSGTLRASSPMPSAYTCLAFACEKGAPASTNLRKAVALCLDRNELLSVAGIPPEADINGFCSVSDPAYVHPANVLSWPYQEDLDLAIQLLEEDGWTLNENGESYDASSDGVRCRLEDSELVRLSLSLSYSEDGSFDGDILDACLVGRLARVGVELICEPLNSAELSRISYSPGRRLSDIMLVTIDIYPDSDMSAFFMRGGSANLFGINDLELYLSSLDTYRCEEGDYAGYFARWLDFQARFIDALPAIPLYCLEYPY